MVEKTLADRILDNFSTVSVRKTTVKVPKLIIKPNANRKSKKKRIILKSGNGSNSISSIVNLFIKSAFEKAKKDKKEKQPLEEKSYKVIQEDFSLNLNGGYGTISRSYGSAPANSYVDYAKIFSYLGKFRAGSPYEQVEGLEALNKTLESGSFTLVETENMNKGARYVRHFGGGKDLNPLSYLNPLSLVPVAGMNSGEWEQFKMWMKLESVMYLLKISTA